MATTSTKNANSNNLNIFECSEIASLSASKGGHYSVFIVHRTFNADQFIRNTETLHPPTSAATYCISLARWASSGLCISREMMVMQKPTAINWRTVQSHDWLSSFRVYRIQSMQVLSTINTPPRMSTSARSELPILKQISGYSIASLTPTSVYRVSGEFQLR